MEKKARILRVEFDPIMSQSRGRQYYWGENGCYTHIRGEWFVCTDTYEAEPDVHVADDVHIVIVGDGVEIPAYKVGDSVKYRGHVCRVDEVNRDTFNLSYPNALMMDVCVMGVDPTEIEWA